MTYLLINRTRLGRAMRATFQDRDTAALMGVDIDRVSMSTFALGSGLAAAAGALLGPIFVVTPTMGDLASLKAFAIVILGGLGNIMGATVGGFILAFIEELGAGYISSGYRDAMGFALIIVILRVAADRPLRREGALRVKRLALLAFVAFLVSVPLWVGSFYMLHVLIVDRHLHHRGDEPQSAARLYGPAQPRPCRLLRHRRLCVARSSRSASRCISSPMSW